MRPSVQNRKPALLPDEEAREDLIRQYAPQIRYIAHRLAMRLPPHIPLDDLINAGMVGLVDALEKFDPGRESKFKTYAEFRIRGAMLDELRAMDWLPRSVRKKSAQLQQTYHTLEQRLGRAATEEEVAEALHLDLERLHALLSEVSGTSLLHLEDLGRDGTEEGRPNLLDWLADQGVPNPLTLLKIEEMKRVLGHAIERLPEKERLVVTLYYYEELTMKEVGKVLDVSESRVSQLHTQAIHRLKARLKRYREEG